jgi:hypothetical protein
VRLPTYPIRRTGDGKRLLKTRAPELTPTIVAPGVYVDEESGDPVLLYAPPPPGLEEFRAATLRAPRQQATRQSGLRYASAAFGYRPRSITMKEEACRAAKMALDAPTDHAVLVAFGGVLEDVFRAHLPQRYESDRATLNEVDDGWRLRSGSVWTSGNLNYDVPIPYHLDRANYSTWSGMVVIRRHARGGHLHLADYDEVVACRDGHLVFFDGTTNVHGVTPLRYLRPDAYRISGVYFAMKLMRNCLPCVEEQRRGRASRTAREDAPPPPRERALLFEEYWN